jgi:hypothetical protein
MAKKSLYRIDVEYILIIVLLIFSGNPIRVLAGKYAVLITSIVIFVIIYQKIKKDFYATFLSVAAGLMLIFISQYVVLGFVSWLGAFNYITTFFLGGLILYSLGENFPYKFFIVVSYIALISLVFYPTFNLLNLHPPGLLWGEERYTYLIYTYVEEHHFRNCGMFWEPGAFAGILTLCLAFNVKELPTLWKKHKFKLIVIVTALLTTQSTTGYIICFFIGAYYLLFFVRDKTIAFTLLPVFLVIAVIAYTNATFLQQKVEHQSELTLNLDKGEFSNSRFGSFIFDMHYIKKHPVVGNGFHEKTRYADDPEIIRYIELGHDVANANGFSNFIACMGIPFMFFYVLLSYSAVSRIDRKVALLVVIVILLCLIGEAWLNFPLFTGIIFIKNRRTKYENRVNERKQFSNSKYLPQL